MCMYLSMCMRMHISCVCLCHWYRRPVWILVRVWGLCLPVCACVCVCLCLCECLCVCVYVCVVCVFVYLCICVTACPSDCFVCLLLCVLLLCVGLLVVYLSVSSLAVVRPCRSGSVRFTCVCVCACVPASSVGPVCVSVRFVFASFMQLYGHWSCPKMPASGVYMSRWA